MRHSIEAVWASNDYDTYVLNNSEKYLCYGLGILALTIVSFLFYHSLHLSLLTIPFVLFITKPTKRYLVKKRKRELTFQFKDALYSIAASIAAGRTLSRAIQESIDHLELIYGKDALIALEFAYITKRFKESKETEQQIFLDFTRKCGIPEITSFFDAYQTCRDTGGDVEKIVMKSAGLIMEKITIKREIAVMTAQKKMEGRLLMVFPLVIVAALQITSPDYLSIMYTTLTGRLIMTIALCGILTASILIQKITDIDL